MLLEWSAFSEGEVKRDDKNHSFIVVWKYGSANKKELDFKEYLHFGFIKPSCLGITNK